MRLQKSRMWKPRPVQVERVVSGADWVRQMLTWGRESWGAAGVQLKSNTLVMKFKNQRLKDDLTHC